MTMRCFNCGYEVTGNADSCPNCGVELKVYRKIVWLSGYYYNDAVERALVRDLSGAVVSLQQCLKLNKNHIEARNLLGLIYYETGEIVGALSEWVVSKNLRQEGNPADRYLNEVSLHPDELDAQASAVKKYNIALRAAKRGNTDVAIIQLKKVTQTNPRLVKARQLLALLYLLKEDYVRARRELIRCLEVDRGSVITHRYRKEAEAALRGTGKIKERRLKPRDKKDTSDAMQYVSGNETIIKPVHRFSFSGTISILSIGIGLIIGALAAYYLLVPDKVMQNTAEMSRQIAMISEEADAKSSKLLDLERQIEDMSAEREDLKEAIAEYEGNDTVIEAMGALMAAATDYLAGDEDIAGFAEYMESVDETRIDEMGVKGYRELYEALVARLGPDLSKHYYAAGESAFRSADYEEAKRLFALAWQYDDTSSSALYNLAEATRLSGDIDEAKKLYDRVVDTFPGTRRAANADARLAELRD